MKNSGYAQAARAAPLVRVLSEAVLVLVLEFMFFEYENEYAYEYDFDALCGWATLQLGNAKTYVKVIAEPQDSLSALRRPESGQENKDNMRLGHHPLITRGNSI